MTSKLHRSGVISGAAQNMQLTALDPGRYRLVFVGQRTPKVPTWKIKIVVSKGTNSGETNWTGSV